MSHEGLVPDAALPRNTGGGASMESGQQPGALEFPTRPKHLLLLSVPERLLGPVTAPGRASKLRTGAGKDLGGREFLWLSQFVPLWQHLLQGSCDT